MKNISADDYKKKRHISLFDEYLEVEIPITMEFEFLSTLRHMYRFKLLPCKKSINYQESFIKYYIFFISDDFSELNVNKIYEDLLILRSINKVKLHPKNNPTDTIQLILHGIDDLFYSYNGYAIIGTPKFNIDILNPIEGINLTKSEIILKLANSTTITNGNQILKLVLKELVIPADTVNMIVDYEVVNEINTDT